MKIRLGDYQSLSINVPSSLDKVIINKNGKLARFGVWGRLVRFLSTSKQDRANENNKILNNFVEVLRGSYGDEAVKPIKDRLGHDFKKQNLSSEQILQDIVQAARCRFVLGSEQGSEELARQQNCRTEQDLVNSSPLVELNSEESDGPTEHMIKCLNLCLSDDENFGAQAWDQKLSDRVVEDLVDDPYFHLLGAALEGFAKIPDYRGMVEYAVPLQFPVGTVRDVFKPGAQLVMRYFMFANILDRSTRVEPVKEMSRYVIRSRHAKKFADINMADQADSMMVVFKPYTRLKVASVRTSDEGLLLHLHEMNSAEAGRAPNDPGQPGVDAN